MIIICTDLVHKTNQPIQSWEIVYWRTWHNKTIQIFAIVFETFFILSYFNTNIIIYRAIYNLCILVLSLYLLIVLFIWFLIYLTRWWYVIIQFVKLIIQYSQDHHSKQPNHYNSFIIINIVGLLLCLGILFVWFILPYNNKIIKKFLLIIILLLGSFVFYNISMRILELYSYFYDNIGLDILDQYTNKIVWVFIIINYLFKNITIESLKLFTDQVQWLFVLMVTEVIIVDFIHHYYQLHDDTDKQYCLLCSNQEHFQQLLSHMGHGSKLVDTAKEVSNNQNREKDHNIQSDNINQDNITNQPVINQQLSYKKTIYTIGMLLLKLLQPGLILQWHVLTTQWNQIIRFVGRN